MSEFVSIVPVICIFDVAKAKEFYMRPGLSDEFFGRLIQVWDPFGNRIRFIERKAG